MKTSLYTRASLRPVLTGALLAAGTAAAVWLSRSRSRNGHDAAAAREPLAIVPKQRPVDLDA